MLAHPQSHLWAALKKRFADQRAPSTSPDRLLRGLCVVPLEGQEESQVFALGFREAGTVVRSVSLSRDFQGLSELVAPDTPCYLLVYVGDVQQAGSIPGMSAEGGDWMLVAHVPSTCSAFEAKRLADARTALKAELAAEAFVSAAMWVVSPEQITLSNCMRTLDGSGAEPDGSSAGAGAELATRAPMQADEAAERLPFVGDATDAVWEERIKGLRGAYTDSCTRLVGALEELEQTLCGLTGDEYRKDEPLLHARAHMARQLALAKAR